MKHQGFVKHYAHGILYFLLILVLFACGGGTAVRSDEATGLGNQPAAVSPVLEKRYDVISFQKFEADPQIEADYPGAVADCERSAIANLQSKNLFSKVEKETAGSPYTSRTLLIRPKVESLRIVGGAARFWAGGLVGSSGMIVGLKMIDAASGMVIHEKVLSTANNPIAAAWTFGATDRSLPADMGAIISEYIVSSMPAK